MIIINFLVDNFFLLIMLAGLAIIVTRKSRLGNAKVAALKLVLVMMLALIVCESIERWTAAFAEPTFLRTLLSVIGYIIRPIVAYGYLLMIVQSTKVKRLLSIPLFINMAVYMTAFFWPVAFYFDAENDFTPGPLHLTGAVVAFFYILVIVILTIRGFGNRSFHESVIILFCALICVAGAIFEMSDFGYNLLNSAIVASCNFYYMFLHIQFTRRDEGTGLKNRQCFFEDLAFYEKKISAFILVDMNGLKALNDAKGHLSGDEALYRIGNCLEKVAKNKAKVYRIGGDEFQTVCFNQPEERVKQMVIDIKTAIEDEGLSVAIGYAMRMPNDTLEETCIRADKSMYSDKTRFYTGKRDRRKSDISALKSKYVDDDEE